MARRILAGLGTLLAVLLVSVAGFVIVRSITNPVREAIRRGPDPGHVLVVASAGPSLRAVIDVGAWHNSRFVLPGGQSGNPLSPHYDDLFELWRRGEGVPIAFTPQEMKAAAVTTLELRPAEER